MKSGKEFLRLSNMPYAVKKALRRLFKIDILMKKPPGYINASVAGMIFFDQMKNLIRVPVGPAFGCRSRKILFAPKRTEAYPEYGKKYCASCAMRIWDMCLKTGLRRQI